jgi:hypothetical protein
MFCQYIVQIYKRILIFAQVLSHFVGSIQASKWIRIRVVEQQDIQESVESMMDKIFKRLMDHNFSELAGLSLDGSLPVPEALLNELIEVQLRGNRNLSSLKIRVHRENRLSVDLRTPRWPWPLNLKLQLFRAVDLSTSPKLRAFLENYALLGKLGALFKVLPAGITLYNDQLALDLEPFLPPEYKKFLPLVKSVDIRTEESKLILDVNLER